MKKGLYIVWSDDNNLGIPIIDEQHRGIVSTINSLHHFIITGHGQKMISPIMVTLQQFTDIHFSVEEALMSEAGYPDFDEHIKLHKTLISKTKEVFDEARKNKDPYMVLNFLKEWWLVHINKQDRKYVPFMEKLKDT
ncbi:MAG: hemerythrin family protein [Sedimentisphaerales bacterium]|nr:hemerythrin family protein [Sedimentisphaerales bacterium]